MAQKREQSLAFYGYAGFTLPTPAGVYRTVRSRGYGLDSGPVLYRNDLQCRFLPLASGKEGFESSKAYDCWDDPPPDPICLIDELTDCADGFHSFRGLGTASSDGLLQALAYGGAEWGPAGIEVLADLLIFAVYEQEVIAAVVAAEWVETMVTLHSYWSYLPTSSNLSYGESRYAFRFAPPGNRRYSVRWTVYWTPQTWNGSDFVDGTPEEISTEQWRWDGVILEGYDPEDGETWPQSPWFELPRASEQGYYSIGDVASACTLASVPTAPSALLGGPI